MGLDAVSYKTLWSRKEWLTLPLQLYVRHQSVTALAVLVVAELPPQPLPLQP